VSVIAYASDLHGNAAAYEALFAAEADAIVLGGDLLPMPRGTGGQLLEIQRRFAADYLVRKLRSRPCYWIPGNDDWAAVLPLLEGAGPSPRRSGRGYGRAGGTPIHGRAVPFLDGLTIAGYSCVPVTPFGMKDFDRFDSDGWTPALVPKRCLVSSTAGPEEVTLDAVRSRGTIAGDLERLAALSDPAKTVYVLHSPPYGSTLDLLYDGTPIGSPAIRAFVERHAPPLTLHGHIHESPGVVRLGRTVCVNPGDSVSRLRAVAIDLADFSVTPLLR